MKFKEWLTRLLILFDETSTDSVQEILNDCVDMDYFELRGPPQ